MNKTDKAALATASASANKGARTKGTKPAAPAQKKGKTVSASSAAALKSVAKTKANAETTAQPGVIAMIMTTLLDAKTAKVMLTVDEIVGKLALVFPERPATGMAVTVRAQLSRLPFEKEFAINKVRDGRTVRYAAI